MPSDPANTVELTIYEDAAIGHPGSVFYAESFPNSVDADGDGSFTLEPTGAPTLNPVQDIGYKLLLIWASLFQDSGFWIVLPISNDDAGLWQNQEVALQLVLLGNICFPWWWWWTWSRPIDGC